MDEELREMAEERICKDYNGCVDDFGEREIRLQNGMRVHKISFDGTDFHYYNRWWYEDKKSGKVTPQYQEIFPTEEEEYKILDEFYAWY